MLGLEALRRRVSSIDEAFNLFDAYSDLITLLLNHAREASSISMASALTHEFNSYLEHLWLLERSGQERGIVNGILGRGSFNVPILLKANGYISQQEMLLHDIKNSAQQKHFIMLEEVLSGPSSQHVVRMRQSVIQQAELNDLLNRLHSYIGYGGLIHTFKNYVIRGDGVYAQQFHKMLDNFKLLLHEMKQLFEPGQNAMNRISIIEITMDEYHDYLEKIHDMRAKGKSISEIDKVVKIDDQPAFDAIEYLRRIITQIDQAEWWEFATIRINQINKVKLEIEKDLYTNIKQGVDSSYQTMLYNLIAGLIVLILTTLFAYYLIRHVAGSLTSMANQLQSAAVQKNYNPLLSGPRKDEIGMLANAFNNLIAERQTAEQLLRKLSSSVEQTSESMVIINRDKIIEYANPATERLTGFKASGIIGKNINLFQYDTKIEQEITRSVLKGESWRGRAQIHQRNDGMKPIMLAISPIIDDEDKLTHLIVAQQDISELEQLEEQFYQSQKMESIGNLVGGIAHDFNNILAGMTGKLYLARKKVKELPEEALRNITDAEDLGFKAASMIQQLLTFARRDTVKMDNIDLVLAIKEAFRLGRIAMPENIQIDLNAFEGSLPIQGDTVQTHQILINLINNAIHAVEGRKDAHVSVSVSPFHADDAFIENNPDLKVRELAKLSVEDNGVGISKENIKHVFEPFYTTKGVGKGTGLGLSMIYGAIQRQGGVINIESELGAGCRIDIYFPIIEALTNDKSIAIKNELYQGDGETVLIVDDDVDVLETHCSILKELGYTVVRATDGVEAVEYASKHAKEISLVMMDVVMPNKGGVEAAGEIRAIAPHVPIIFMTGYDKEQALLKKANQKDCVIMSKPVPIEELALHLYQLIKNA